MSRPVTVLAAGALVLAVLLVASLGLGAARARQADAPGRARQVRDAAVADVRAELADVFTDMDRTADRAAGDAAVRRALVRSDTLTRGDTLADAAALAALARLDVSASTSVDVVSRRGALVAWAGIAFPRAPGPPPDSVLSQTVRDDAGRRALALWVPVTDASGRVVGGVRVVRLAQAAVPVRNRYLQDYDIADEWRPRVAVPFTVSFGDVRGVPEAEAMRGTDGRLVGRVSVGMPTERALDALARRGPEAWAAFWATLLMLWFTGGLVTATLARVRVAEGDNRRVQWVRAGALLALTLAVLTAVRYGLLALDVPVRWLDRAQRTAALFDPAVLALDAGDGLFRSPGDLALTAVAVLAGAGAVLAFALRYAAAAAVSGTRSRVRRIVGIVVVAAVAPAVALAAGGIARQAVLDATIGYTD